MKLSRKMLALLLCMAMVFSLIPMAGAEEAMPMVNQNELVIFYTNDVHTYIDKELSYDTLAGLRWDTVNSQVDDSSAVLLFDAGDHIQGTAYGSMDKGETITQLMEAASYDLATLGNHEFDYGMERALEVMQGNVPYVSCNFYHEENGVAGESVVEPYVLYNVNDVVVAVIGITTPETFTKSTPAYFQDENGNYIYGIAGGTDGQALYTRVQETIDAAAAEADVVIALGHLGDDPASQPWTSEELIANTTGLDAFIDGHSHSTVAGKEVTDKEGNTVLLTQTGEYFNAVGRMVIDLETLEIDTGLLTIQVGAEGEASTWLLDGEYTGWEVTSNEEVAAIKDAWIASIDEQLGEVIGYAEVTLDNYDADGKRLVRKQETNTGDFAADALYYLFDEMDMDVDVAIMNGGGVRNKAITGELSYKTMKDIHTFGNVACLQTITGQQLLDALEWGARGTTEEEIGGFLHVSGITYEIHTYINSTVQADEKGVWTGAPTGEYRVRNVKILQDGKYVDLDLNAKYNLAGYNYTLRDLGDGFAMFDGAVNVLDYVAEDYMVLANYVESFPVNEETGLPTIAADSEYADVNGAGRITLVTEKAEEPEEPTEPSEPTEPTEPKPVENPFKDVKEDAYYYESVLWAVEKGITTGMTKDTFAPDASCTRAQMVTFLWRNAGSPEPKTTENPFTDVKADTYYYKAVLWAYEQGITTGVTKTLFAPDKTCTRAEAVTFLWRAEGEPADFYPMAIFEDVEMGQYFARAVYWAYKNGITTGATATTFAPNENCSRAQIVTFLFRAE